MAEAPSASARTPDPRVAELIARGEAAERDGRRVLARARYEAALHRLRDPGDAPLAATLMRWFARTLVNDGNLDAAEDAAAVAAEVSRLAGDATGMAHVTNLQGNIQRERGDLEAAEGCFRAAIALGESAGARAVVAMAQQNIGIVLNIRGDLRAALRHYRASLAEHRALGQQGYAAHVLNNLGMLYTDLRRWRAAAASYAEAVEICSSLGDAATQARVESNRAELWIAQRRWDDAARSCDAARALAASVGDTVALGEALKHLGVVARERGQLGESERHLRAAQRLASERGDLLLGAETARELAALLWLRHDHPATLRHLNRAHRLFSRLQARRDLAEIAGRLGELEAMFLNIVTLWGDSIESADPYTRGHCERVADYACALAEALGMDAHTRFWLRLGALLHDVGKIAVPSPILNKEGPLTPEERALMQRHPDAGVEMVEEIDFPWDVRPMIRHHHEAWDGSGYPLGLRESAIPLAARILCVADIYDALTSDRPYRRGHTPQRALEIMQAEAGRTVDPELFARFRTLPLAPPAGARKPVPVPTLVGDLLAAASTQRDPPLE